MAWARHESSRAKRNGSHKLVSKTVHNVLYYAFPLRRETLSNCVTDCAVLTIVTMQSAFEPQARKNVFWDSSFEKSKQITTCVVYINTVCDKSIFDAVNVVKSKPTLINSDLCNPAMEPSQTKLKNVLRILNDIYLLISLLLIAIMIVSDNNHDFSSHP